MLVTNVNRRNLNTTNKKVRHHLKEKELNLNQLLLLFIANFMISTFDRANYLFFSMKNKIYFQNLKINFLKLTKVLMSNKSINISIELFALKFLQLNNILFWRLSCMILLLYDSFLFYFLLLFFFFFFFVLSSCQLHITLLH